MLNRLHHKAYLIKVWFRFGKKSLLNFTLVSYDSWAVSLWFALLVSNWACDHPLISTDFEV